MDSGDCPICAKHRGEGPLVGPLVWEDEHCLVFHKAAGEQGSGFLGHLFIETRRHAPYLSDLSDAEAVSIGRAAARAARGLRAELNADFVFSAIVGRGVAHFHQHVFARHPGTPDEYGWMHGDQWPQGPRGNAARIAELCVLLRPYFL